jgi:hypothetical protein
VGFAVVFLLFLLLFFFIFTIHYTIKMRVLGWLESCERGCSFFSEVFVCFLLSLDRPLYMFGASIPVGLLLLFCCCCFTVSSSFLLFFTIHYTVEMQLFGSLAPLFLFLYKCGYLRALTVNVWSEHLCEISLFCCCCCFCCFFFFSGWSLP